MTVHASTSCCLITVMSAYGQDAGYVKMHSLMWFVPKVNQAAMKLPMYHVVL